MPGAETDADAVARRCAEVMWAADRASRHLGMALAEVRAGRAVLTMPVGETMVNGHDICHGGYIATLADSAFAFACNSYDVVTVAAGFDITFLRPAHRGETLCAVAEERARSGRSGIYDVTVWSGETPEEGERVAEMRGRSRSLARAILA